MQSSAFQLINTNVKIYQWESHFQINNETNLLLGGIYESLQKLICMLLSTDTNYHMAYLGRRHWCKFSWWFGCSWWCLLSWWFHTTKQSRFPPVPNFPVCYCLRSVVHSVRRKTVKSTVVRGEHKGTKIGTFMYVGKMNCPDGLQQKATVFEWPETWKHILFLVFTTNLPLENFPNLSDFILIF